MLANVKIKNLSSVIGTYTKDALNNLLAAISTATTPGISWTNLVPENGKVLPISASRSYYCKVLYSPTPVFNDGVSLRSYVAFFGDGVATGVAYSDDGYTWNNETTLTGIIAGGYHGCPILVSGTIYFYYWNPALLYNPAAIRLATINPAVNCHTAVTDTPLNGTYINGGSGGGNLRAGSYGFCQVFYNAAPTNNPLDPYSYQWCALHNGTDGSQEGLLFATSPDGLSFTQWNGLQEVIPRGVAGSWDTWVGDICTWRDAVGKWFCYFAGGVGTTLGADSNFADGLGYAESNDGITWTKYTANPVMFKTFSDHTAKRCYNPWVIKETSGWRMYITGKSSSGSGSKYVTFKTMILYFAKGS